MRSGEEQQRGAATSRNGAAAGRSSEEQQRGMAGSKNPAKGQLPANDPDLDAKPKKMKVTHIKKIETALEAAKPLMLLILSTGG